MNRPTALAIQAHARAIEAWGEAELAISIAFAADAVEVARTASQDAIDAMMGLIVLAPKHDDHALTQAEREIDAACTDAEAEAAIQAHADAIRALLG